ncbi:hypothetical protein LTR70_010081 [Exophiala xenobiotica]|uniref:C2H2-type domain-containing protein n=1 Tax=Lithohypha guttulata TaxID=1690604 RepID=A0ABR0JVL8_9EURO|nr:hypothetical protein LTR24_010013 [Lithohypha guttulata]KAK5309684.1 hypothetical protein LTR70_010081 [Exophiala xenobiotica]
MFTTLVSHDLLLYNAKHKVLICRECKYAIQKSALGSHLLRHKIYRGERQRLLSSITRLELLEADDVQLPLAGSPPVHELPIFPGYRCTATGCESLYASFKRVRRHCSQSHGVSDPPESFARSVNLQTFFRGTKLRYFEVDSPKATPGRPPITREGGPVHQHSLSTAATSAARTQLPVNPSGPPCDFNMETLRYFHHFMTTTSLTLPVEKRWQNDVVAQALRLHWLMCGLLAISASHLAALAEDETTKQGHQKQSTRFLQDFSTGWKEVKYASGEAEVEEAKTALDQEMTSGLVPFRLQSFAMTLQGCIDADSALQAAANIDDPLGETFLRARKDSVGSSNASVSINAPPALLERFRNLPYRMAEALEKPDSAADFFATLSAIDLLVECCSLSYASDDVGAVWDGMESWLRRLSGHFNLMVRRRSPAALIVLAHWSLLVERAERYCWFLRGSATKVRRQIIWELPEDSTVQSLVENLMG